MSPITVVDLISVWHVDRTLTSTPKDGADRLSGAELGSAGGRTVGISENRDPRHVPGTSCLEQLEHVCPLSA